MSSKYFSVVYALGHQLYDYYLYRLGVTPVKIQGKLGKAYLQYFVEVCDCRYAIRFVDSVNLSKEDIGKEAEAEVLYGVTAPEGYAGYCRKVQFVTESGGDK
jgi:hypothetical protein